MATFDNIPQPDCDELRRRLHELLDRWTAAADLMDDTRYESHLLDKVRKQLMRAMGMRLPEDDHGDDLPF